LKKQGLSGVEWSILNSLWENNEMTVKEVQQSVQDLQDKAYTTIQTYLERMVKYKYLKKRKRGSINFYYPVIDRESILKQETTSFLSKIFNGSVSNLAAFLLSTDNISKVDLKKLKSILAEEEKKHE
jgi:predicted transcriptional regulator